MLRDARQKPGNEILLATTLDPAVTLQTATKRYAGGEFRFPPSTIDANTADRYVLQTIGQRGCDPVTLFELVRDDIGYETYQGSLRGARGALWSQAGELPYIKPCAERSRSIGHRQVRIKPEDPAAYIDAHRVAGEPAESQPADNPPEAK